MAEALSSHDALVLEKKLITQDSKTVAFASFVSKTRSIVDKLDSCGHYKRNKAKKNWKPKKNNGKSKENLWKHESPKKG